jgi:hypothetical protein
MEILTYGLSAGLMLSVVLSALIITSLLVNPEIWVDDYPPDIKARFGPIGDKARRQRRWVAVPFFLAMPALLAAYLPGLSDALGGAPSFWQLLVYSFIAMEVFNLVDLLILDWLFFVRIQPSRIILPGTEGLAGYKDYGFHLRGFLLGNLLVAVVSLVFAGVAVFFV